ncbi:MAG: nitrogen fixation protein NifQ [Rubrivivax sp.]
MPVMQLAIAPALLAERARRRADEVVDVAALLQRHAAADADPEAVRALAQAIALACLGDRHLWEDLGLPSRAELGRLMQRHFPSLVALNDRGMRWKKFLYRQLCIAEQVLICRSPSCEVCDEQPLCFGPELAGSAPPT